MPRTPNPNKRETGFSKAVKRYLAEKAAKKAKAAAKKAASQS